MVFHWAKEAQKQSVHFHRCRYALENENGLQICITLQLTESKSWVAHVILSWELDYNRKTGGLIQKHQLHSSAEGIHVLLFRSLAKKNVISASGEAC